MPTCTRRAGSRSAIPSDPAPSLARVNRGWLVPAVAAVVLTGACSGQPAGDAAPAATTASSSTAASTTSAPPPPEPPDEFTLVATGDVLVHQGRALTGGAATGDGGHDFTDVFAGVAPVLQEADVAICHLETPVAPPGGPYRGYPSFVVQPEIVDALAEAGYDVCSTASNHSLDDGFEGLVRTRDTLEAAGIAATGTYRSEAETTEPTIVEVDGVRVGHVAVTFSTNGVPLPAGREWSVDLESIPAVDDTLAAAQRAREAGADVVVASVHCCTEYRHPPTDAQVTAAQRLLASPDVDLVLGHHAHVVQPFERIDGEWVAYGLGNHLAEHATRGYATEDSVIARFTFTRAADGSFEVTTAEAVPVAIEIAGGAVRLVPADPATAERVTEVVLSRGASEDGLTVVAG
jgi:poly-gamma-glutamate capsule biosynthesis protein CapA/YwtB (metallophosphatase superfamily)